MAWVQDFDGDGDLDVFGTDGIPDGGGAIVGAKRWLGFFTIFNNVDFGQSVFFQGAVGGMFAPGDPYQVVMQWQGGEDGGSGVEAFTVPADPVTGTSTSILHIPHLGG